MLSLALKRQYQHNSRLAQHFIKPQALLGFQLRFNGYFSDSAGEEDYDVAVYDSIERGKQTWQNLKDFTGQFGHDENLFDTLGDDELEPYKAKSFE